MSNPGYLILGGGGHAAALAEILIKQKKTIIGVVAPDILAGQIIFDSVPQYLNDDDVLKFSIDQVLLVNGIGAMPRQTLRKKIYIRFSELGYTFATIIADSADVSRFSSIGCGAQVMKNCVVNIGTVIAENTIINTATSVDHDCNIGEHCHLAPGVTLSGHVTIGSNAHIATGVNVINNITIGEHTIIGVGANITKSIPSNSIVHGARSIIKNLGETDDN